MASSLNFKLALPKVTIAVLWAIILSTIVISCWSLGLAWKQQRAIAALLATIQQDESWIWRDIDARADEVSRLRCSATAVRDLIPALSNCDKRTKINIYSALRRFGSDARDAVPVLIAGLRTDDHDLQIYAASALRKIGLGAKEALPDLVRHLYSEDSTVRGCSAAALGEIGAVEAVPFLLPLLFDNVESVRTFAVMALRDIAASGTTVSEP